MDNSLNNLPKCKKCEQIAEELEVFRDLINDYRNGRNVQSMCKELTHSHLDAINRILL